MFFFYLSLIDTEKEKVKLELIHQKYCKLMFYIANQILRDASLAEDAVQDAFIKIIENMDKIGDVDCYKTKSFIVVIVRNHAINLYNKRKRYLSMPPEDYEYKVFKDIFEDENNCSLEDSKVFGKALMQLPVIYRDILTLKFVQELSNAKMALLLNISEAAVRKRIERAKKKIKDIVEKEND